VPVHAALGASGLPARAPAHGPRGHMVDPRAATGRPLGRFFLRHGHPDSPGRPAIRRGPPQVVPGQRDLHGIGDVGGGSADGPPACLAPAGPRDQPPEDDGVGPGSGACGVPARGGDAAASERGHGGVGGPDPRPSLPIAGGRPFGQVLAHVRGRGGSCKDPKRPCAHAVLLGPTKVLYALRTLPIRHTAAFAADVTANDRAT